MSESEFRAAPEVLRVFVAMWRLHGVKLEMSRLEVNRFRGLRRWQYFIAGPSGYIQPGARRFDTRDHCPIRLEVRQSGLLNETTKRWFDVTDVAAGRDALKAIGLIE